MDIENDIRDIIHYLRIAETDVNKIYNPTHVELELTSGHKAEINCMIVDREVLGKYEREIRHLEVELMQGKKRKALSEEVLELITTKSRKSWRK